MRDILEVLGALLGLFVVVVLPMILVISMLLVPFLALSCDNKWSDYPHRFEIIGGCLVQDTSGKWIPEKNWVNNSGN